MGCICRCDIRRDGVGAQAMIAYGEKKRKNKLHPHNECAICSEKSIIKKSARQDAKRDIEEALLEMTVLEKK